MIFNYHISLHYFVKGFNCNIRQTLWAKFYGIYIRAEKASSLKKSVELNKLINLDVLVFKYERAVFFPHREIRCDVVVDNDIVAPLACKNYAHSVVKEVVKKMKSVRAKLFFLLDSSPPL